MPEANKMTAEDQSAAQKRDAVVREVLNLSENDSPETVRGKLVAIQEQAKLVPGLNERIKALELAEEQRNRATELNRLLETGRLTNAMAETDYFKNMDSVELAEYGKSVPEDSFVNTKKVTEAEKRPEAPVKKSKIFENLGLSEDEIKNLK